MTKQSIIVLCLTAIMFCQCGKRHDADGYGVEYPMSDETAKYIDSCMSLMNSNPTMAHKMLDSISNAGQLSPQRCGYYQAMVIYSGDNNPDSALAICNRLLEARNFGDDQYIEEELCVLASNITSSLNRHVETLKYANRGIALCHGHEMMRSDEATLVARVGVAQQQMGRTDEARKTYAKAYDLLDDDETFGGLIGIISIMMKQARLYFDAKEYDQSISVCQQVVELVARFDRDPSFVKKRPETMIQKSAATRDFADFYECQMYADIASAYRMKVEKGLSANPKADADSVKHYMDLWAKTDGSRSASNISNVIHELYFTGRRAEFNAAKTIVAEFYRNDSLVSEYVDYLVLMAKDAADNHDLAASNACLRRAVAVSDSIRKRELVNSFAEQLTLNMVQEEQLARQDAENEMSRQRFVILLLSTILIIIVAVSIIVLLMRKNRENQQIIEITQHDLSESKEDVKELTQQLAETKAERTVNNTKTLYERIEQAMVEKRLYLNPEFDIKMLADEVCSSRTLVSVCINSVTGKTFRQWLSEYRLNLFVDMLKANPHESIDILMLRSGYKDQSTFRRQFKITYGMTAGEYRRNLLKEIAKDR